LEEVEVEVEVEDGWRYVMAPNGEIRLVVTTQGFKT
jgi:hypothetical protein